MKDVKVEILIRTGIGGGELAVKNLPRVRLNCA
jgi:hypothetical protein